MHWLSAEKLKYCVCNVIDLRFEHKNKHLFFVCLIIIESQQASFI